MNKPMQKRRVATRTKLIAAAREIIAAGGYGAMRVEEVVQKAGVAKGTFFAHFRDKDALMALIIGAEIDRHLDEIETLSPPMALSDLIAHLGPLMHFMTCERYVFDVIIRHSGAVANEEIGAIARTFTRHVAVVAAWISEGPFRKDVPAVLLADGVQAFMTQAMALHFCAIHNGEPMQDRLATYLGAWLMPTRR